MASTLRRLIIPALAPINR